MAYPLNNGSPVFILHCVSTCTSQRSSATNVDGSAVSEPYLVNFNDKQTKTFWAEKCICLVIGGDTVIGLLSHWTHFKYFKKKLKR